MTQMTTRLIDSLVELYMKEGKVLYLMKETKPGSQKYKHVSVAVTIPKKDWSKKDKFEIGWIFDVKREEWFSGGLVQIKYQSSGVVEAVPVYMLYKPNMNRFQLEKLLFGL